MTVAGASSCGKKPGTPELKNQPRQYATDSEQQIVYRKPKDGEYEIIKTSSPRFDEMTCVFTKELGETQKEIIDLTWKCKEWEK